MHPCLRDFIQCWPEQLLHELGVEPQHSVRVANLAALEAPHRLFHLSETGHEVGNRSKYPVDFLYCY